MIDVAMPTEEGVPDSTATFAACLASVTESDVSEVPLPLADVDGAVALWRSWLAGRGLGMVLVASPSRFSWPGYWIAVLGEPGTERPGPPERTVVLMFGTPAGVVLSPEDPSLLGRPATALPVRQGYVVAALDPAEEPRARALPTLAGRVDSIALASKAGGPMRQVERVRANAGRGLVGDRYWHKRGTFSPGDETARGYDLTLVAAEDLDELVLPSGEPLPYTDARRNIVTRGIDLNALVGRRFRIGDVECLGQRLCEPCSHLEKLTQRGVLRQLIHRGGLRADVLRDGEIARGARIVSVD